MQALGPKTVVLAFHVALCSWLASSTVFEHYRITVAYRYEAWVVFSVAFVPWKWLDPCRDPIWYRLEAQRAVVSCERIAWVYDTDHLCIP